MNYISILRKVVEYAKQRKVETKGGDRENRTVIIIIIMASSYQVLATGQALGEMFNMNKLSYLILTVTL